MSTLNRLSQEIHNNALDHGFWDVTNGERNFGEAMALIHSEVSEALEEHRVGATPHYVEAGGKPVGTATELADVLIRTLDALAGYFPEVDIDKVVAQKMEYNSNRPHKHGKAY